MSNKKLVDLLKNLNICYGDTVFLHSSYSRLKYLNLSAREILETILEVIGREGTLTLPAYAWGKSWDGYHEYYKKRPVFDVINTPANIGYIPEAFRQMENVERSLSYWWSICSYGKFAKEFVNNQEHVSNYYGEGSSFDLLRRRNVKILGLGVTLNTTSLCPIVDYKLGEKHPNPVFTEKLNEGIIIDKNGKYIKTYSKWLKPDIVRYQKPSKVFEYSKKMRENVLRKDEKDKAIQFSYDFNLYYNEAYKLGMEAINNNHKLPWLENIGYE